MAVKHKFKLNKNMIIKINSERINSKMINNKNKFFKN